ncbi:hypothetical protein BJ508DRAFT_322578 [Ascobolus immersus RN42]|uniref:Uncharacterized protein n=1 Tax=Ascobolus immersus RN42 TaxID=1160509 RepID=A0A3N4ILF7_ASCIM|nr:hypothetical protein BJ508DRAFT_322578 [Ascobolus immersus RN42]
MDEYDEDFEMIEEDVDADWCNVHSPPQERIIDETINKHGDDSEPDAADWESGVSSTPSSASRPFAILDPNRTRTKSTSDHKITSTKELPEKTKEDKKPSLVDTQSIIPEARNEKNQVHPSSEVTEDPYAVMANYFEDSDLANLIHRTIRCLGEDLDFAEFARQNPMWSLLARPSISAARGSGWDIAGHIVPAWDVTTVEAVFLDRRIFIGSYTARHRSLYGEHCQKLENLLDLGDGIVSGGDLDENSARLLAASLYGVLPRSIRRVDEATLVVWVDTRKWSDEREKQRLEFMGKSEEDVIFWDVRAKPLWHAFLNTP